MKRASIDIGSNTVLLLIADVNESGELISELENESRVTSLGKDLDRTGVFREQSMKDTYLAFLDYQKLIKKYGVLPERVIVTATEASRVAKNAKDFLSKLEAEFSYKIHLINAEGEAHYTSLGVVRGAGLKEGSISIMDIGGASTELIKVECDPFNITHTISLPMGSVRCSDWLKDGCFVERSNEILSNPELNVYKTDHLLCVAGSMTSLGGMIKGLKKFNPDEINGSRISFEKFLTFAEKIKKKAPMELLSKFPFLGKRAESIVGGAHLGEAVGKRLDVKTFEISTLGLRYGTIMAGGIDERFQW